MLWRRNDVESDVVNDYALAHLARGARPLLATVLWSSRDYSAAAVEKLSFLDPDTGALVRQTRLPLDFGSFPHDPRKFVPNALAATDIDRDGVDEIVVSYSHVPEAPSFIVLYEPRLDRARTLFSGTGHHHFAGVHDVDGDGRPEVLLLGINNGFDWINAMAAVRISPWIGETKGEAVQAQSPDLILNPSHERDLVWYALLPRFFAIGDPIGALAFDDQARKMTLTLSDRRVEIGMDGFLVSDRASMPAAERNALRRAAYAAYRESGRLRAVGAGAEAVREITRASEIAARINEPILREVMERARGVLLIRTGSVDEGERVMRAVWQQSENRSEVAYDAAVACHLHGDIDRAVKWYELGVGPGGAAIAGKGKHEFIQGLVLALAEQQRWKDADGAIDRFAVGYPNYPVQMYRQFVRWRRGETPDVAGMQLAWNATDILRYWMLEFRLAAGAAPADLLPLAAAEIDLNAQPQSAWRSLRAELLWRAGRKKEAAAEARAASIIANEERTTSIIARGHLPVIHERFARIAGGKT